MQDQRTCESRLWVVHDRHALPRWGVELLALLCASDGVPLYQVSVARHALARQNNSWNQLINALDAVLFPGADTASVRVARHAIPETLFAKRFHLEKLRQFRQKIAPGDRILNLGSEPDAGVAEALDGPVMSLACGRANTPTGLVECLDGARHTELRVLLTRAGQRDHTVLLAASACTDSESVARTRNAALWTGAELLRYAILAWIHGTETAQTDNTVPARVDRAPGFWQAVLQVPLFYLRGARRRLWRRDASRQRILLYTADAQPGADDSRAIDFASWQRVLPPRDVCWSNPFPVERGGRRHVFIEEASATPGRGHVSVIEIGPSGEPRGAVPLLKRPYHLSYPNVFEHRGEWYMVPESGEHKSLQLYRCTAWPHAWTWQQNLIEGRAIYNGTLLEHKEQWWLFATVRELPAASPSVFLHLWHADSPFGPWRPHRANPVVRDVRRARPAGRFFYENGLLYRPSKDCSTHYGYGLNINRVDQLDLDGYRETCVASYAPWSQDIEGVHTLNQSGSLKLADAIRWRTGHG